MDPKANNMQNSNPDAVAKQPSNPVSSGNPEIGPIQVERPVSEYSSYPAPPANMPPPVQPTPSVKISDDIASKPSLESVKGNMIDLKAAQEKFEKGDIKESGTWEAGVQVYDTGKQKKTD